MTVTVHQIHLEAEDMPVLKVQEFESSVHGCTGYAVSLECGSPEYFTIFCRTADQVRRFVPAFVSQAEQAALDAEDEATVCDWCGTPVHLTEGTRKGRAVWRHEDGFFYCEHGLGRATVNGSMYVESAAVAE